MRQRQDNVICFSDLAIATLFFAAFPAALFAFVHWHWLKKCQMTITKKICWVWRWQSTFIPSACARHLSLGNANKQVVGKINWKTRNECWILASTSHKIPHWQSSFFHAPNLRKIIQRMWCKFSNSLFKCDLQTEHADKMWTILKQNAWNLVFQGGK